MYVYEDEEMDETKLLLTLKAIESGLAKANAFAIYNPFLSTNGNIIKITTFYKRSLHCSAIAFDMELFKAYNSEWERFRILKFTDLFSI